MLTLFVEMLLKSLSSLLSCIFVPLIYTLTADGQLVINVKNQVSLNEVSLFLASFILNDILLFCSQGGDILQETL